MTKKTYPDWRITLKRCLKQRGMRATDLANKTGLSNTFLSNYIGTRRDGSKRDNNKNHINISEANFNLIAKALDMHPAELRYNINISINVQFFMKCRKAIIKAAKDSGQHLTEEQKAMQTAIFYNNTISMSIIQNSEAIDVIDIVS